MEEDFAQGTTPLGALRGILGNYPYSVGLFREILQNSDDAGASKQTLLLDRRTHSTESLYHPKLAPTQGPALLAYNDAKFNAHDWHALKFAYESSKVDDSSKIGKYGVGFRSLFHITDCPQIVSGEVFAMFDPLQAFTDSAGKRLSMSHVISQHPSQLTSFDWFFDSQAMQSDFNGTIIRCPLRLEASKISSKVVAADDISHLFREFIFEEIDISLLFLQNIQQIEIYDVDERGVSTCMAQLTISRSSPTSCGGNDTTFIATVTTAVDSSEEKRIWRVVQCPFQQTEAIQLLSRGSNDPSRILKEHKLLPNVGIAAPLDSTSASEKSGRLFTFLPLPLPTGFPVHIHAYFALTQSRQNLRNSNEIGLIPGTDDHLLIEWNKLLFEHYIPQAWKLFLEVLADMDSAPNLFATWPPEQRSGITSGENVYWKCLPENMFNFIASSKSSVWPIFRTTAQTKFEYQPLDSLITAEPSAQDRVLKALTAAGLRLTCPPQYIVEIIRKSATTKFSILTPEEAHKHLLTCCDLLQSISKDRISIILEFLLSTQNVLAVVGLPIISLNGGKMIALRNFTNAESTSIYNMLDRVEFDVFGACDDDVIALHLLPPKVAETLQRYGPALINVKNLAVPSIIEYIAIYPTKLGIDLSSDHTDLLAVKWLSTFWAWLASYARRGELFPSIRSLLVLPSNRGLRNAEAALFKSRGEHPIHIQHLSLLGVPFLDAGLSDRAQTVIASYGLLNSISNIHALLDCLPTTSDHHSLSKDTCETILRHISSRAHASCIDHGSFSAEHIRRLRSLPIYPIVHLPPNGDSTPKLQVQWSSLPDGSGIRAVERPTFLPLIDKTVFIQLNSIAPDILRYLHDASPLSDIQLLSLTAQHLVSQPDQVQAAALQYMVTNRRHVPPYIIDMVRNAEFVLVDDGSRKKPSEVIDPNSVIAPLYTDSPSHHIRRRSASERSIVSALQSLELLKRRLTVEMVRERIDAISSQPLHSRSTTLARTLLTLIDKEHLDVSYLDISSGMQWLPTNKGLCSSAGCRDGSQFSPHLFDRVLAVLEALHVPISLKRALKWDQPLSTEILIQQLGQVLQESGDIFVVVLDIIKELGKRDCTSSQFDLLQRATHDRKWVPTTDRQLCETMHGVFLQPLRDSGFYQIYPLDSKTQELLRRMECMDSPSANAVIVKLEALRQDVPSLNTVNVALSLLRSAPVDLDEETRSQLLIPDTTNTLRPFAETFFNDIGDQARLIPAGNSFISHHFLDESLSRKLGLGRLGLRYAGLSLPSIDMGEKPVITVRKNLRQYTEKQFVSEFFANAADAGATEFSLMLNTFCEEPAGDIRALSPIMAKFCMSPTLVVYNNATFADEDFEGICRTSVGGKGAKRDKIGQFGLGALTMFHFTELAIVVSNDKILFLNPSKAHLPVPDVAALMLSLNHVRNFYPSQLASIDGLFGFNIASDEPYNGTIFSLPLREDAHCIGPGMDVISSIAWSPAEIRRNIIEQFRESAPNSLLFTQMHKIEGIVREAPEHQTTLWSFIANRDASDIELATGYSVADVLITDSSGSTTTWTVAKATVSENDIPEELQLLAVERRLRLPPVAGLAVIIGNDSSTRNTAFRFFSTLPLPITTSLPLHIMASFVLSSDRRQIRLDEYGGPETRYNSWLLNDVIPPLYLFLLEHLLELGDDSDNRPWWPQHRTDDDAYSRHIVTSFYSLHLRRSTRRIFRSMNNPSVSLTRQDAVISGDEPVNIGNALVALGSTRTVNIPSGARHLAIEKAGVAKVTPAFLKDEILRNPAAIAQSSFKILESVIGYLAGAKSEDPTHLLGLPILPLEDGTFGTFEDGWSSTRYYVWTPRLESRALQFPLQHFVLRELKIRDILKMDINVVALNPRIIKQFIEERFENVTPSDVAPEISNWIYNFWETWPEYHHLKMEHTDILNFPLVPTVRPNVFVSLAECRDGSAVLVGDNKAEAELLRSCLDQLDLQVVRPDEEPTPLALRRILQNPDYPSLNFELLLTSLNKISAQSSIAEKLLNLDNDLHTTFASWARDNITQISEPLIPIAQHLPIWPSARSGFGVRLQSASEIHLLPNGLSMGIAARFMNVFVANYGKLKLLEGPTITFEQMQDKLELPSILSTDDLLPYRGLLDVWLKNLPASYRNPLPVPNANRSITPSDQLYARQALFEAAFGDDQNRFIPPEFAELEEALQKHGLRTEAQLDVPMFRICAEAINNRTDDDKVLRAGILFEAYGFQLPMQVGANEQALWHELDEVSFIPRNSEPERRLDDQNPNDAGLEIPIALRLLPSVVAPLNFVRKEFEAIAWTQKALFDVQPHQRVLLAYPALGKPSIPVVIHHLRALSSFHNLSRSQRRILLHDLTATYEYLNDNILTATDTEISQIADGDLFLNVDDPNVDDWKWDNSNQLVFETEDPQGYIRCVRGFLMPFAKLLRAAGVLQVNHPQYAGELSTNSETLKLEAIRTGFDKLRKENALTDVVFVTHQDDSNQIAEDLVPLVAHRAFLSVSSEYFSDAFCGGFAESRVASPGDPVRMEVADHISRRSVELVLDYIYTGSYAISETSLELLLETMQLSAYWQIMDLFEEMQKQIVVQRLINPRTLDLIRETATNSGAEALLRTCVEYAERNPAYIRKIRQFGFGDVDRAAGGDVV